jgi:hypothetical protein
MTDPGTAMGNWREQQRRRDRPRRDVVLGLPALPVRHHGVISGPGGDVRLCASPGPAGEVVAVWTAPGDLDAATAVTVSPGGASFPDPGAARPVAARITVHAPGLVAVTRIAELALAHITVQPMPGGRFLVAGARCRWRPGGPDPNAVLYDAGGQAVSAHVLGDGIAHLQATSTGHVWAGYFDEGIYGNYGWGRDGTPPPVGAPGIVRFSPALEPAWHYPRYTGTGPCEAVSDCSALNAGDAATWACYDPGYPVVRIRDGTVTGWHNEAGGACALAAAGSRVALSGGYGPDYDRLALTELGDGIARLAGEYRVVLPDGQPLPPGTQVTGRGPLLHFLTSTDWYQLDIDGIPG